MSRMALALAAFVVLGVLTWSTLTDPTLRVVTLAILALFAAKTWLHRKQGMHPSDDAEIPSVVREGSDGTIEPM